ncbi:class I SAM-dependent methyltransferase [Actinomycetospora sp. C-140]
MTESPSTERPFLPAVGNGMPVAFYDTFTRLLGARPVHWQLVAQAGLAPGQTVLEIGVGTGEVLLLAARVAPGATFVGLDPDPAVLELAARKAARQGATLHLERGYADRLPQPDGSVDRVLSSFMFHHLPPDQQRAMLAEVHRVLAPGGSLHLSDPDASEPGVVGLFARHAPGHDHGHGHGADHGHGHGAAASPHLVDARDLTTMLAEAGFTGVDAVTHRSRRLGRVVFHRAVKPA